MNFDLSEDQVLFKATVERFVAPVDVEARRKIRAHDGGYDRARWRKLAEMGLIAMAADEAQGGMGGLLTDLAVVAEALGTGNACDPWLENGVLPARLLAQAGNGEVVANILNGSMIAAFAFAEPGNRYSIRPSATGATATGDGFTLSGEKRFVMGGALADWLIVSAKCDGNTGFFLVSADADGIHRRSYRIADGSIAAEIQFHDVTLDADAKLSIDDDRLQTIIAETRLLAGAEMVGLAQRLLDDTLAYVKEREQFGVAIGSFQAIQHRLVECYAMLEQARSMLWRATLASRNDGATWCAQVAGAKAFIGDQADHIAQEATQFHGGMGVTDELGIGHALKRVLVLRKLFGDAATEIAHYAEAA